MQSSVIEQILEPVRQMRDLALPSFATGFRSCLAGLLMLALSSSLVFPLAVNGHHINRPNPQPSQSATLVEAAAVRHAPVLNGRVEGSVRQLLGVNVSLSSAGTVTGDLLVPGTPTVRINGTPNFGGTINGTGSTLPTGYSVILNSGSTLGRLVRRTDPISLAAVSAPPASPGTRSVTINSAGQSAGNFATLRDLTLIGNAGLITVPPGTYRNFTASSGGFVFGVPGSTQPAVYNLSQLTVTSGSQLQIVGPVVLTIGIALVANDATVGALANPNWLTLKVAGLGVLLNDGCALYGILRAPNGIVTLNNSSLYGSVHCDRLILNGSAQLVGIPSAPPTLDSITPFRALQSQTKSITLAGHNTHWLAGQTRASFGGEVSVGGSQTGELGLITVVNETTAIAEVTISETAALSPRTVRVVTNLTGGSTEEISLTDAFTVLAITPPGATSTKVTTIAGGDNVPGFVDGPAGQARFRDPAGVAIGPDDGIYIADAGNSRVRVVREQPDGSRIVQTLAGDGTAGHRDGAGAQAQFNDPRGVAVDANGAVYVADTGNHRIRRVATDGTVSTLAGDGTPGYQNGAGIQARFNAPRGVALDQQGNLYVADTGNSAVRIISAGGNVQTVAGDGTVGTDDSPNARFNGLQGVAIDGATVFIYLTDSGNHRIRRLDNIGTVITLTGNDRGFADGGANSARFAGPSALAVDGTGRIVVADTINSLVRLVTPELIVNGSSAAVSTVAGSGERGLTNGAGNVARFNSPQGVAVNQASAIIVADTGNHVLRRIGVPPVITSFAPSSGRVNASITIYGEGFDGRAPDRNSVKFTRISSAGGGQTTAQVTAVTRTQLSVVVPTDAASGSITVTTADGTATSPSDFVVDQFPVPVITDFNPKRGPVGTQVILTGTGLKVDANNPVVSFAGSSGTSLTALLTSASAIEVRATVPNGAITGPIQLANAGGITTTATPFTVDLEQDFQLTVAPSAATAVQGGSATYIVYLTSGQSTFSQLASLTVTGLPAGITATFDPAQITAGASSTFILHLSGTLAPGSYPLTIHSLASVGGHDLEHTAGATLNVMAGGLTTLSGRVLSTEQEPIMGATVSLDGRTATTDAAGAFLLSGITSGTARPLMVDGRTASAPNRTYPIIIEPASIVAGQANVVPYIFYLPLIDTQYEVEVVPGQNTNAGNPRVPGLQMTIPAGANLRNRDGSPVARTSITPLAIDRTPAPLPSNVSTGLVYTSQPGGAISDVPMPVVYPNLLGVDPGTRLELYAFNHDTVQWYIYGYGRVSSDGRTIAPETDPATGRPYGLRDFSWHFPNGGQGGNPGCKGGCGCNGLNPVNYPTGIKLEISTDVAFGGARGGLTLTRYYTSDNSASSIFGRFGRGARDNYEVSLTGSWSVGGSGRVIMPDEQSGRLFSYARTETDGTSVFTTTSTISQLGDVVRRLTDGTLEYRYVDGRVMRFDAGGRMIAAADQNGNTTLLTYSGSRLTQITDAVGRSITLGYDPGSGFVSSATDPLGHTWSYKYGGSGTNSFLTAVTDPLGNKTSYSYDNAALTSVTDPRGNLVKRVSYDSNGRVIRQQFADGGFETYKYVLSGGIVTSTTITDPLGRTMTKRFNANGYVAESVDALGQRSQVTRGLANNLATATVGPCGCSETTQEFDERGNIVTQTDRLGRTFRIEHEPLYNNPTKFTDQLGRVETFGYDAHGNLTSVVDALGQTTSLAYNGNGLLTRTTDPLGHIRQVEYDASGNVSAAIDELGQRNTFEHDPIGRLTAVVDALGRRTSRTYDVLNRVVSSTDSAGATITLNYDDNGNVTSITDALNHRWTRTYDGKNRVVSSTDPLGRRLRLKYNTGDELTQIITPAGRVIRYEYTQQGLPATITDPLSGVLRSTYDSKGALVGLTDPRGYTTTFTHDELGRPLTRRDPLGRLSSLNYDQAGNIVERIDQTGRRTTFAYDALNRPRTVSYPDAIVSYSYDAGSRPTRIDDTQSGYVAWTYDDAGRLLTETTPNGLVAYGYNVANQPISMTAAEQSPVSYEYDTAGRLHTITQGPEVFTYSYDELSRPKNLKRPNAVSTNYAYDEVGRLVRLTHALGQTIEDFGYTYNADGQIETISSLASGTNLASEKNAATADAANRIAQLGPISYSFNELGQTAAKIEPQGPTSYQWDARGRLTRTTLPDGQTVSYDYDALGRRASRTAAGATTSFLYNGANVVVDRTTGGGIVEYLNGPGIDNLLRQKSAPTGALYFAQDHLGSTVALTNASGAVVERTQYEAFGQTSGSSLTRYGFTGRERDNTTGLMYYRARWYDPQQGRFISEDPIGFSGGDANLYAYVWQSPLGHTDALGLDGWGNDSADWLDGRIGALHQYLGSNPDAVYFNTGANYATNIYHGVANLFRVGSGVGHAIYDPCDNGYGRAANVLEDVARAAAIFELLGGPAAGVAGSGSVAATSSGTAGAADDMFAGVQELSRTLQEAGVSRAQRLEVINSYRQGTIRAETATGNESFIRFFGGEAAEYGRFMTTNFPNGGSARTIFALPPGNTTSGLRAFQLEPGTRFFQGTVAPNFGMPGGGIQVFVPNIGALR